MDRKNTVRHLIQMMAITEEQDSHPDGGGGGGGGGGGADGRGTSPGPSANLRAGLDLESKIPPEFLVRT